MNESPLFSTTHPPIINATVVETTLAEENFPVEAMIIKRSEDLSPPPPYQP